MSAATFSDLKTFTEHKTLWLRFFYLSTDFATPETNMKGQDKFAYSEPESNSLQSTWSFDENG